MCESVGQAGGNITLRINQILRETYPKCHTIPLQKAVSHKDVENRKSSTFLTKSVN